MDFQEQVFIPLQNSKLKYQKYCRKNTQSECSTSLKREVNCSYSLGMKYSVFEPNQSVVLLQLKASAKAPLPCACPMPAFKLHVSATLMLNAQSVSVA